MERNFTREELEKKKIQELKDILANRDLKKTGKKDELIDRILNSQISSKPTKLTTDQSYFNLLPSDIREMVNDYRAGSEENNKILREILRQLEKSSYGEGMGVNSPSLEILQQLFQDLNLDIKTKYTLDLVHYYGGRPRLVDINDPRTPWTFKIGRLPPITDEILVDLISVILTHRLKISIENINQILREHGSNIRVVIINISKSNKAKYIYEISNTKIFKTIE